MGGFYAATSRVTIKVARLCTRGSAPANALPRAGFRASVPRSFVGRSARMNPRPPARDNL